MSQVRGRLRRYFLVGLVVIAPVGITAYVLWWIFQALDAILGEPIQAAIGFPIPGLGFLLLGLLILAVGWIVHNAVGRKLLHWWNQALVRFPVIGRLYNALSQIVQTMVGGEQRRLLRRVVLIPFPTETSWTIGFVTSEESPVLQEAIGEPCVNVFLVTTPNPTTGFFIVLPRARVKEVNISIEDAMKLVISAGAFTPSSQAGLPPRRGLDLDRLLRDERG